MKRIAIFGAKGYLGKQLTLYFSQKSVTNDGFDMPECDVTSEDWWATFEPTKYDAILFFAGLTGTEKGFGEAIKYTAVNEMGLLHLLIRLVPLGVQAPRVVFPSTRLVYKGSDQPQKEGAPKDTKTVYAVNKLACEGYLAAYSNRFGIPYNVIRICVPYGSLTDAAYSYGTVGFFLKQIAAGKPITLFGGGTQGRTFTHVEDICRAVEALASGHKNGIYNVGGTSISLGEAARMIAAQNGGSVVAMPWPAEALKIESGGTIFDASKMMADFGVVPEHTLEEDVKEIKVS